MTLDCGVQANERSILRITTRRIVPSVLSVCIATIGLTGCQTLPGDNNRMQSTFASNDPCADSSRNTGAVIGGVLGAFAGALLAKNGKDKVIVGTIGATAGALLGGVIGHNIDERRCALSKVAKANNLDLVVSDIKVSDVQFASASGEMPASGPTPASSKDTAGLSVSIIDKGEQFAPGSASLTPQAAKAMADLADTYRAVVPADASAKDRNDINAQNRAMRILLVGHTDDTGSSQANADLSEARARSVARIFVSRGFSEDQIFYQGAGETLPIADNHTAEGRARNRRVEVVDLSRDDAMAGFLANRKPVLAYYRAPDPATPRIAMSSAGAATPSAPRPVTPTKPTSKKAKSTEVAQVAADGSAASQPAPVSSQVAGAQDIDFGGKPVQGAYTQVSIGNQSIEKSAFAFLSTAHADEAPIVGSCANDRPRISKGVKSLKDDKEAKFATGDYLPGVYDTSWVGTANGHLVALTHVAVLRDGGAPARRPELLVYADYHGDKTAAPTLRKAPEVNAYQGSDALLYRVFVDSSLQCMDVVIPNKNPSDAPKSNMAYVLKGQPYQVAIDLKLLK